jgi:hypothetical protein
MELLLVVLALVLLDLAALRWGADTREAYSPKHDPVRNWW